MNKSQNKTLIVISGPTAVGKTTFSVELAKRLKCQVISADSRQFFKEMKIGTARPSEEELQGVPHHFLGFLSVQDYYSAGMFELDVLRLLERLFKVNDYVIMVGGSGLYIQAVCQGMNEIPDVDLSFREQLYQELAISGLDPLVAELERKDPKYAQLTDLKNTQRVIRALEVIRATGQCYSSFRNDQPVNRPFNIIKLGIERNREELYERINLRVDQMISQGLFEEAKTLYTYKHLNSLLTVGYKEIFAYLDGNYSKEDAIRVLKRNSRRYAKRQITWFKKDAETKWFHPDHVEQAIQYINYQN
ncbi:MAG: tRNA (adenosine(37)-N6)-dimethylallyltransferase MiaA [Cyclobacteriaceae bacterium]